MRGQRAGKIDDDTGTRGPDGLMGRARPKHPCPAETAVAATARQAVRAAVRAGAVEYRRASILPRLVPVAPAEVADDSPAGTRRILALLARALRSERRRGRAKSNVFVGKFARGSTGAGRGSPGYPQRG